MRVFVIILLLISYAASSKVVELCKSCTVNNFNQAFQMLNAGDTLNILEDSYNGGNSFSNLKGKPDNYIIIRGIGDVNIDGGNTAIQLSDWEYVRFENIIFQNQLLNGVNVDDAGTFDTPTHHIQFLNCTFKDMQGTGNNDLLKLSGLDDFLIQNCIFENGSSGGSGVDMVGCHSGTISQNMFSNFGSNSIQCKGGTSEILIERNYFLDGGARGINLGGSTGLQFFRPLDATYEAANLRVFSNIFVGGDTPFAFVGSTGVEVYNNTIINPNRWIFRILQETVDENRFVECGDNFVINNLFYVNSDISNTPINIGSNTRPETFEITDNFLFNLDNSNWSPNLIDSEINYLNINPELSSDYTTLDSNSKLIGKGKNLEAPELDFNGKKFLMNRSIGAIEGGTETINKVREYPKSITYYWEKDNLFIKTENIIYELYIYDLKGKMLLNKKVNTNEVDINLKRNIYFIIIKSNENNFLLIK